MEIIRTGDRFLRRLGNKFLSSIPPFKEWVKTPEQQIEEIISGADSIFIRSGWGERAMGKRLGKCGVTTDLVKRSGEYRGVNIKTFQNYDVQRKFGNLESAFRHAFNVAFLGGRYFLVDISGCQYILNSGEINEGSTNSSGTVDQHPIAQHLLDKGYVELTDSSLREYLDMMGGENPDNTYLQNASVKTFMSDFSLEEGYDGGEERIRYLDGLLSGEKLLPEL